MYVLFLNQVVLSFDFGSSTGDPERVVIKVVPLAPKVNAVSSMC